MKLADLYIELGLARTFLLDAEKAYRMEHIECARELIALLMNEISEHRCKPWWSQTATEHADREGKAALN